MRRDRWKFPELYLKGKFREQATGNQLVYIENLLEEADYSLKDILASIPGWKGETIQGLITKGEASFIIGVLKGDIKPLPDEAAEREKQAILDEARRIMTSGIKRNLKMDDIRPVDDE